MGTHYKDVPQVLANPQGLGDPHYQHAKQVIRENNKDEF